MGAGCRATETGAYMKQLKTLEHNNDLIFDIEDASRFLNLKVSRIRYEIFRKSIPYFKIGRSVRFSKKDLISWVLNQKQESQRGSK